jgi:hypothetical protein
VSDLKISLGDGHTIQYARSVDYSRNMRAIREHLPGGGASCLGRPHPGAKSMALCHATRIPNDPNKPASYENLCGITTIGDVLEYARVKRSRCYAQKKIMFKS